MNKLICDACKTVNESGTLHCRQCGGKLTFHEAAKISKVGRKFRKFFKKTLIVLLVLLALAVAGLCALLFRTSGFASAEIGENDARTAEKLADVIYRPQSFSFSVSSGEATLLARKLLEKSGVTPDSGAQIEIFIHNNRNIVAAVLYSKLLDFIPSRCELGFKTGANDEPELKYARIGVLYMPGALKHPAAWLFKRQAIKGDNVKLLDRIERVTPRGNKHIIVKLGKD